MLKFATASIVAASALSLAGVSSAATLALNSYTSTPAFPSDTRLNGSATNSSVMIDGIHTTVKLQTTDGIDGQEKVAPFFNDGSTFPALNALGTLGDLGRGGLTLDWLLQSRGANAAPYVGNIAAIRLLVGRPDVSPTATAEIIWETGYQTVVPTFTAGVNYDNVDIGSGLFYSRYAGQNYGDGNNGGVNALSLADLAAGGKLTQSANNPTFSDSTPVYGLEVSIGSAAGDYTAYVGDINATFTAVPEPTTLAIFGLGAIGLLARRRRVARA